MTKAGFTPEIYAGITSDISVHFRSEHAIPA